MRYRIVLLSLITMSITVSTFACGNCVFAMFDLFITPIRLWCMLVTLWFLKSSYVVTFYPVRFLMLPNIAVALVVTIVLWFLAVASWGPLTLLPLAIPPIIAIARITKRAYRASLPPRFLKQFVSLSIVFIACLSILGIASTVYIHKRPVYRYILAWEGTGPGEAVLIKLEKQGKASLPSVRQVAMHGKWFLLRRVAPYLEKYGDARIDVPILIDGLQRIEAGTGPQFYKEVEHSLRVLTGYDLPEGTKSSKWREKWQSSQH